MELYIMNFVTLIVVLIIIYNFISIRAQLGGKVTKEQQSAYAKTGRYKNNKFQNLEKFTSNIDCHSIIAMLKKMLKGHPNIAPTQDINIIEFVVNTCDEELTRATWLGHSSFLIEIDGKNILLDPVYSKYAAPHPLLGKKRYNSKMPVNIDELSSIDFVIISHDHYDHLDCELIKKIKNKANYFLVPLGVGNHLRSWGVPNNKILELDWWEEKTLNKMNFVFAPAKHMSGRSLTDQKATLWGSWIIKGLKKKIYFSGDSGYGSHFKEIGKKYGPFDIGLMECGQYDELWPDVHMMPEQTIQAAIDIKAKLILPIHWGGFTLANHSWTDPIERVLACALQKNIPITTPKIGETVELDKTTYPTTKWWENYR